MSRNRIRDGYTRTATIKPYAPGTFEEMKVTFRPMLPVKHEQMNRDIERAGSADAAIGVVARAVAEHITDWSEVEDDGSPVPVTAANVKMLPPPLVSRLKSVVSGFEFESGDTLADDQKNS